MGALLRIAIGIAAVTAAGCGSNATNGTTGPTTVPFGDPQVVGLSVTIDEGVVQIAMAAQRLVTTPEARDFAARQIDDHGALRDRVLALAQTQGIAVDRTTAEAGVIRSDAMSDIMLIQSKSGIAIDQRFMGGALHDLTKDLMIYDNTLLARVTNPALRDHLQGAREVSVSETDAGQSVLAKIGGTAGE